MNSETWNLLNWAFLLVPAVIGVLAVRIGSRQVREFHERTGESNVVMSVAALSLFHDDDEPLTEIVVPPASEESKPAKASKKELPALTH